MAPKPKKKPLCDATIRTDFGELLAENVHADPERIDGDVCYTPGWSEMRVAFDKQMGEVARGERKRSDVVDLPVNLRYTRRCDTKGNPDAKQQVVTANMGYEAVNVSEAHPGNPWLTRVPDGCQILPGGLIAKGDTILMKCTKEKAARNAAENFKRIAEANDFEFDDAPASAANGQGLNQAGGTVTKVKTDGPINIKDTGKLK